MKNKIITSVFGLISASLAGLACSSESLKDTTEVDPSAVSEGTPAEVDSGDTLAVSIPASRETWDATAVQQWQVSLDPDTDAIQVRALDLQGEAVGVLELELDGEVFALRMGTDSLRLDADGRVLSDTLPSGWRELFHHYQLDAAQAHVEYADCLTTMVAATVVGFSCLTGALPLLCPGIAVGVCAISQRCGNNACAF